jgi:methanogenic corrinoid protein MtbC1
MSLLVFDNQQEVTQIAQQLCEQRLAENDRHKMKLQAFQRQMLLESLIINVGFLKLCLQLGDHSIFVRDTEWTFLLLCSRLSFAGPDFIKAYLIDQFEFLAANAQKVVRPEQVAEAKAILTEAVLTAQKSDYQSLSRDYLAQGAYPEIKQQYLQHLLNRDIRSAQKCLDEALKKLPFFQVYTDFIQNVMYQVGELWQLNKITVAQEHYCTAATQMIMAQLYPVLFDRPQNGKRVVVSCVGNELHEMGARMLSDLFTYEGWDSIFLGAAVPKESLLQTLQSEQPLLCVLVVSMVQSIPLCVDTVAYLKKNLPQLPVAVGGYAFKIMEDGNRVVKADIFTTEAGELLAQAGKLD